MNTDEGLFLNTAGWSIWSGAFTHVYILTLAAGTYVLLIKYASDKMEVSKLVKIK